MRRARRIAETIERLLKGEIRLGALMAKRRERPGPLSAFTVAPEVLIDNALSHQFTVIEVAGLDRPGLLYELTNALSDLNLDITSAHITTFGVTMIELRLDNNGEDGKADVAAKIKLREDKVMELENYHNAPDLLLKVKVQK